MLIAPRSLLPLPTIVNDKEGFSMPSRFTVPAEGIGLIIAVDRFLDMCRTCVNVTGDLVGTVVVARGESATEPSAPV